MRRSALLAALLLLPPAAARALADVASIGTTSADFLQLGVGARALAMGEAYYDYLAYGQNLGAYGSVGASLQYFTLGGVNQTSLDGTGLGTYNPYDIAVSAGYARAYRGFLWGVSGKYISSRLATTAKTEAVDFGVTSPGYFRDRLRLALVAQNLGGKLQYDQVQEKLPLVYKAGSSWRFNEKWSAALDAVVPSNNQPYGAFGVERTWRINPALAFAGRAGYNSRTVTGLDGLSAFSFGVGFSGRDASIDYAFVPLGALGLTHRFSLSWKFDARRLKRAPRPPKAEKPKETSSVQASVQYSTQTSLPPPAHLHCEEYHGVTVCMDADQREGIDISYDPGDAPHPAETSPHGVPAPQGIPAPKSPADGAPPAPAPKTNGAEPEKTVPAVPTP